MSFLQVWAARVKAADWASMLDGMLRDTFPPEKLGSGKFDRLSGRFLRPDDDLDAMEPLPEAEPRG